MMIDSMTWAVWWVTRSAVEDVWAAARDALAADDMMREGASVAVPDAVMAAAEATAVWAAAACVSECWVAVGMMGGASTGCVAEVVVRSAGGYNCNKKNTCGSCLPSSRTSWTRPPRHSACMFFDNGDGNGDGDNEYADLDGEEVCLAVLS